MTALAFASAIVATGCGPGGSSAVGTVVAVDPAESGVVEGFTLRTGDGATLEFEVGTLELDGGAFTADHLRDHLATAQPIAVAFRMEEGMSVAYRLVDAPWFTP